MQERIAACEARLLEEVRALAPEQRRGHEAPQHPNAVKAKALRGQGKEPERKALWQASGVDLTRIDGISVGTARTILTEVDPGLSAFPDERQFVSRLCPRTAISGGKPLKGKLSAEAGVGPVAVAMRMAAVSLQRLGSGLPQPGAPQGLRGGRLRYGPQAGRAGLLHAALGPGLRQYRSERLRGSLPAQPAVRGQGRGLVPGLRIG